MRFGIYSAFTFIFIIMGIIFFISPSSQKAGFACNFSTISRDLAISPRKVTRRRKDGGARCCRNSFWKRCHCGRSDRSAKACSAAAWSTCACSKVSKSKSINECWFLSTVLHHGPEVLFTCLLFACLLLILIVAICLTWGPRPANPPWCVYSVRRESQVELREHIDNLATGDLHTLESHFTSSLMTQLFTFSSRTLHFRAVQD